MLATTGVEAEDSAAVVALHVVHAHINTMASDEVAIDTEFIEASTVRFLPLPGYLISSARRPRSSGQAT